MKSNCSNWENKTTNCKGSPSNQKTWILTKTHIMKFWKKRTRNSGWEKSLRRKSISWKRQAPCSEKKVRDIWMRENKRKKNSNLKRRSWKKFGRRMMKWKPLYLLKFAQKPRSVISNKKTRNLTKKSEICWQNLKGLKAWELAPSKPKMFLRKVRSKKTKEMPIFQIYS